MLKQVDVMLSHPFNLSVGAIAMTTKRLLAVFIFAVFSCASAAAQTTAFSYQGSLKDGANPANGNFDFEFKLFDAVSAGTQQGSTQQRLNVAVVNGVFAVSLDFGAGTLPGADRFLDIAVRTAGGGAFTTLAPRQLVNSAPYAVRSLNTANADSATNATNAANAANATTAATATNATQLGGVAANQYVLTGDPRMSDPRPPTAGSGNYIQNGTSPQASSNFNISGNGILGGNLGIGTQTAQSPLTVFTSTAGYGLTHTNGTSTVGTYVNGSGGWLGTRSNHPLNFFTNNGFEQITLTTNGNVGIGTTAPSTRLSLNGGPSWTSFFWTASMNMQNASALGWEANASGQRFGMGQSTGGLYFFRTTNPFGNTSSSPNYIMTLSDGGNVGIGNTNPTSTLDVNGGVSANSFSSPGSLFLNSSAGGRIALRTSGSAERITILDNGNVGIGTTNPTATLDVLNSLKVSSSMVQVRLFPADTTEHVCYNTGVFPGSLVPCSSAAEYVPSIDGGEGFPESADLVSIAPAIKNPYGDSHGPFTVEKSTSSCDVNLLGFILDPKSGADGKKLNDHYLPLAIYGYFPAKVTLENGPIKRGDPITSSSKAGYGMKSTKACKIIGYALEDADEEGNIQVFAHLSDYSAPLVAELKLQIERMQKERNNEVEMLKARLTALEQAVSNKNRNK